METRQTLIKKAMALPLRRKLRLPLLLMADRRVPLLAKLTVLALFLYLAMPFDLIPDFIPVLGQLDDLLVVVLASSLFLRACPAAVVQEHIVALEARDR